MILGGVSFRPREPDVTSNGVAHPSATAREDFPSRLERQLSPLPAGREAHQMPTPMPDSTYLYTYLLL